MAIKERNCIEFNEAAKCPTHSKTYPQKYSTLNSHGGDTTAPGSYARSRRPRRSSKSDNASLATGGERVEMEQNLFVAAAVVTIVGSGGLIGILILILKNKDLIKSTLADWTRRGRKIIYVQVSQGEQGDFFLHLYLYGGETSWFYPSTYENHESYFLAMRQIHYHTSYRSYSDRDEPIAEWTAMDIKPLSEDEYPCLLQLIDECGFRFSLHNENGETKTEFGSFKFKTELKKCLKKCEIKYVRKASNPQDRWKAEDK